MSEMTPAKATALRKPFPPESIGQLPKGGVMLDYAGHAAITDRLLMVDPEWSWEPFAVDQAGLPALDRAGNLWIRLTVCGVSRIGVGDGKNAKELISDALRNAAMRFGVALDLWAKESLVEFAQAANAPRSEPPHPQEPDPDGPPDEPLPAAERPMTAKTRGQMFALFGDLHIAEDDQLPGINYILGADYTSRAALSEAEAKKVIAVLKSKKEAAA